MHICSDEIMAFMMLLPGIAVARKWCAMKWAAFKASRRQDA